MLMVVDVSLRCVSYDVLRRLLGEHDMVENFRSWYSAHVKEMTSKVAFVAIQSFLVAYHFEEAAGPGPLRCTLGDVAKDVVARLMRWTSVPDKDGIQCAMDMFLSLWDNHHQTRSADGMAVAIQRRFWYSYARWNTLRRLGTFFVARSFTMETFRRSPVRVCVQIVNNEEIARKYMIWIHRMVFVANQQKTADDTEHFEYDPETMSFHVARMAFFTGAHLQSLVMMAMVTHVELGQASAAVMPLLDRNLQGDITNVRGMLRALVTFADVYDRWWETNREVVVTRMQHIIYNRSFMVAVGSTIHAVTIEAVRMHYIIMAGVEEAEEFCCNSPVMKALEVSKQQRFWTDELSRDSTNHELLVNPEFVLQHNECYLSLQATYFDPVSSRLQRSQSVGRGDLVVPLLIEMQAAVLRCSRTPEDAWGIVNAFSMVKIHEDLGYLEREFATYMDYMLTTYAIPYVRDPQRINALRLQWDAIDNKSDVDRVMFFAFCVVREMRVVEENIGINMMKTAQWAQRREMMTKRLPKTIVNTKQWFLQVMGRLSESEFHRIRTGDPFMMLNFLERAFTDLVWDNQRLTEALLPEILSMDASRLRNVRCLLEGVSDSQEARRVFTEVVTANRVPKTAKFTPSSGFMLAARQLRRLLLVCRTVHTPTISALITDCAIRSF
jgi:hypothetical protein